MDDRAHGLEDALTQRTGAVRTSAGRPESVPGPGGPGSPFSPVDEVLAELRAGRMVVLTDDEDRENEGDLVQAAEFVTPESITFMLAQAKGYLCLSLTEADCDRLELSPQGGGPNTSVRGTAFTVSIDGHPRHGFTTGVSARERARCIRMAIDPATGPEDFVRPGHINPLRSRDGGVLVRTGQTEGSLDLCRLAGLKPAAVIIEVMRDDGEMARVPDLIGFCREHNLKMCSVAQIIEHRLSSESLVRRLPPVEGAPVRLSGGAGEGAGRWTLLAFGSAVDRSPHIVLTRGSVGALDAAGRVLATDRPTLVRMHRRNLLGDIFGEVSGSASGQGGAPVGGGLSSGDLLRASMRMIEREGAGAVVYLRPEPDAEADTLSERLMRPAAAAGAGGASAGVAEGAGRLPRSMREFGIGGQILRELGLSRLRLITNHATELPGLEAFGLQIVERVPVTG